MKTCIFIALLLPNTLGKTETGLRQIKSNGTNQLSSRLFSRNQKNTT